jgi:HEAT repeats
MTPAERVAIACDRWNDDDVVRRCARLLGVAAASAPTGDELDLAMVLGGLRDRDWLAGGKPPGHAYWARVWAARALRYVWTDSAAPAVVDALGDDHWRVREMASKVVGDRQIGDAADHLVALLGDDTPRVRAAAVRALGEIGEGEHGEAVVALTSDPDRTVAATARSALAALSRRLDRRF